EPIACAWADVAHTVRMHAANSMALKPRFIISSSSLTQGNESDAEGTPQCWYVRMRASYARYGTRSKKIWEVCRIGEKMVELGMGILRVRSEARWPTSEDDERAAG